VQTVRHSADSTGDLYGYWRAQVSLPRERTNRFPDRYVLEVVPVQSSGWGIPPAETLSFVSVTD
jgi:hypothetical protein